MDGHDESHDEILPPTPEDMERRRALRERIQNARERSREPHASDGTPPEQTVPIPKRKPLNPDPYRDHPDWPGDLRNVQVRLPESLLRALKHLAVDQDTTVSRIICRACFGSFQVPPTWTSSRSEDRLEDWERHRDVA